MAWPEPIRGAEEIGLLKGQRMWRHMLERNEGEWWRHIARMARNFP